MVRRALVILAQGAEESETVILVDVLRRAAVDVTVAGLTGMDVVRCSRKVAIHPDISLEEAAAFGLYDAVILPGGSEGAHHLCKSQAVGNILKHHESSGRILAAICAGPLAFKAHHVATGKRVTCYPSVKDEMAGCGKFNVVEDRVSIDGNIFTSRAPGTAFEFGIALVERLCGKERAELLINQLLIKL